MHKRHRHGQPESVTEVYTPGHSESVSDFMALRTFSSHGRFFARYLDESNVVLDVGCGPGTITLGIAQAVPAGRVYGIDVSENAILAAIENAQRARIANVEFQSGPCYRLPFSAETFDRVFCHALLEHLSRPRDVLREFGRVLKPKGLLGVCSPDSDGFLLAPPSPAIDDAIVAYARLQASNGGDLQIGKWLGTYLKESGFTDVTIDARYECYPSAKVIGHYLARQLEQAGHSNHAEALDSWSTQEGALFAQTWVSAIGTKS